MKTLLKFTGSLLLAAGILAGTAHATAVLTISDGITTITVNDGGINDTQIATPGSVGWSGAIGVWDVNVTTGLSYPVQGSPIRPDMDLNSVDHSTAAGTLTITFTDTFTGAPAGTGIGTIGGTQNSGTVTFNGLQNGTQFFTTGALSGSPFSATASGSVSGGTYTLTEQVVIVHTTSGSTSFDAALSVPDSGSTVMLLGAGLTCLGMLARFRRRFV